MNLSVILSALAGEHGWALQRSCLIRLKLFMLDTDNVCVCEDRSYSDLVSKKSLMLFICTCTNGKPACSML